MNQKCTHKPIILTNLHQSSHDPTLLAEAITSICLKRPPHLAPGQETALSKFTEEAGLYELPDQRVDQYHEKSIITAYFHLFDDLFFEGNVGKFCEVALFKGFLDSKRTRAMFDTLGKDNQREKRYEIRIHATTKVANQKKRLVHYLGTLLHEMVHVFLQLYACEECARKTEGLGLTGHGWAWMEVATAVKDAVGKKGLLGRDYPLGRLVGLVMELRTGAKMPTEEKVRQWTGVGLKEVNNELKRHKK